MTDITVFRNSESAFSRWSITLAQGSMVLLDIQTREEPANQLKKWRIAWDNADMNSVTLLLKDTCNPFADNAPNALINISSGKAASEKTAAFLTGTLAHGRESYVEQSLRKSVPLIDLDF
jgi:hypothetical protein